jgi:mono/diheme cytochrome c family protein
VEDFAAALLVNDNADALGKNDYPVKYPSCRVRGMRSLPIRTLIFAFITIVVMAIVRDAHPQDADRGQIEFLLNCAGCHGTDAKGSGPESANLHLKPVDLTLLAKRNHGRFDPGAVYQMIDGRNARLSYHSAEMPIWGCRHPGQIPALATTTRHKQKIPKRILSQMKPHEDELDSLIDLPCDSEAAIRERLLAIVSYLSLVQEKQ